MSGGACHHFFLGFAVISPLGIADRKLMRPGRTDDARVCNRHALCWQFWQIKIWLWPAHTSVAKVVPDGFS